LPATLVAINTPAGALPPDLADARSAWRILDTLPTTPVPRHLLLSVFLV
jgi:hypothetical protein